MMVQEIHDFAVTPLPAAPALAGIPAADLTDTQVQSAIAWASALFVDTDGTDALLDALAYRVLQRNPSRRPGAQTIVLVTGPNGIGKSTAVLHWVRQFYVDQLSPHGLTAGRLPTYQPRLGVTSIVCPIVWVNVDGRMDRFGLDKAILEALGVPAVGTREDVSRQVRSRFRDHRIRVLVIDDAHFLRTGQKLGRELLDHIKNFVTDLGTIGASVILIGANLHDSDLLADPQIACRAELLDIPVFRIETNDGAAACQRMLLRLENLLGAHLSLITPGLLHRELAGVITTRAQGIPGSIATLVIEATVYALERRASTLTADHLRAVPHNVQSNRAADRIEASRRRRRQGKSE